MCILLQILRRPTCVGILAVFGVLFIALGALVTIYGSQFFDKLVYKKLELVNGGETYEAWRKSPVEPFLKVYFFNVTNSEEFLQGKKPIFKEIGPYVYIEQWESINITWHSNDTVSYIPTKQYFFNRELSSGDESDLVITLNVMLASGAAKLKYGTREKKGSFDFIQSTFNCSVFPVHTVGELLWGYEDELFGLARAVAPAGEAPPYKNFGLFAGKNGTTLEGRYTISTGHDSIGTLGEIDNWNGKTKLPYWRTDQCNSFTGSSTGSMYPPDLKKNQTLHLFNPELCRTLPLVFYKEVTHESLTVYRFGPPRNVFDNAAENSENECYCPVDKAGLDCGIKGLFNISACKAGAPLAVSWPHFLHADLKLVQDVEGLHPDPEKHGFYMDFQPKVAKPIHVKARMQINLLLTEVSDMEIAVGFRDIVFPIFWFETGIDKLPEEFMDKLKMVAILPVIQGRLQSTFFAFGAILLAFVATIASMRMCRKSVCISERTLSAVIEMEIEFSNKNNNVKNPNNGAIR